MKIEVFGKPDCALCKTTKNKLAHFIDKWGYSDRVSLDFVDVDTRDGMAEGAFRDVTEIPTTIVSDNGSTLARWEKLVPSSEEFKQVLEQCA